MKSEQTEVKIEGRYYKPILLNCIFLPTPPCPSLISPPPFASSKTQSQSAPAPRPATPERMRGRRRRSDAASTCVSDHGQASPCSPAALAIPEGRVQLAPSDRPLTLARSERQVLPKYSSSAVTFPFLPPLPFFLLFPSLSPSSLSDCLPLFRRGAGGRSERRRSPSAATSPAASHGGHTSAAILSAHRPFLPPSLPFPPFP